MSFNMDSQRRGFQGPGPETNEYGIFQDKMPWMKSAIKIYSDIQNLCSNNCTNNCGVCGIRRKVDLVVQQLLKEDKIPDHCTTCKGSCLHFQEQTPCRKNEAPVCQFVRNISR